MVILFLVWRPFSEYNMDLQVVLDSNSDDFDPILLLHIGAAATQLQTTVNSLTAPAKFFFHDCFQVTNLKARQRLNHEIEPDVPKFEFGVCTQWLHNIHETSSQCC